MSPPPLPPPLSDDDFTFEGSRSLLPDFRSNSLLNNERLQYSLDHTSIDILNVIFNDMHTTGRPSDSLSPVMSAYASMRLGVHSDATNPTTQIGHGSDVVAAAGLESQYHVRGGGVAQNQQALHQDSVADEYQKIGQNNTWISALTWNAQQADMLALAPGSKSFIETTTQTVDYITVLAHEWIANHDHGSLNQHPEPGRLVAHLNQEEKHGSASYYIRTGSDAIFRVSLHQASTFVSRTSTDPRLLAANVQQGAHTAAINTPILNDNCLHVATVYDEGKEKWQLLGLFLCPEGIAFDPTWSRSPQEADHKYMLLLANRHSASNKKSTSSSASKVQAETSRVDSVAQDNNDTNMETGADADVASGNEEEQKEEDSDDDYWAQYDDIEGSDAEDTKNKKKENANISEKANTNQSRPSEGDDDDDDDEAAYYNSYDKVEHMIHGDDVDRSTPTTKNEADLNMGLATLKLPQVELRGDSSNPGNALNGLQKPAQRSIAISAENYYKGDSGNYSSSLQMQTSSPSSAIKAHVSESVASLYKLAHSQGISLDEFIAWTLEATQNVKS